MASSGSNPEISYAIPRESLSHWSVPLCPLQPLQQVQGSKTDLKPGLKQSAQSAAGWYFIADVPDPEPPRRGKVQRQMKGMPALPGYCGGQSKILVRVKRLEKVRVNRSFQIFQMVMSCPLLLLRQWRGKRIEEKKGNDITDLKGGMNKDKGLKAIIKACHSVLC